MLHQTKPTFLPPNQTKLAGHEPNQTKLAARQTKPDMLKKKICY
jgi:hypothetical protein